MVTRTSIQLEHDADYAYSADQAADQVIAALGGNPQTDTATVFIERRAESNVPGGMLIGCDITLYGGDRLLYDADGCAEQLLAALAGNPTTDTCQTRLFMQDNNGSAGVAYTGP